MIYNKKIKYIAFYNDDKFNKRENRNTFLSITNKVDYICSVLSRNGYEVQIVSPCWSDNCDGYYKGNKYSISDRIKLRNFATFGSNNNINKKAKHFFSAIQLLLFLLVNTKKHEQLIVYHSLALMIPINIAKFLKNLNIILEVEEMYTAVWGNKSNINKETRYINKSEKYILVSDLLKNMFQNKPSVVLYGGYQVLNEKLGTKKKKNVIDIVYAGSIDSTRGGASNAILCMNYLPTNYRMHILGFGEQTSIYKLQKDIILINNKKGYDCCKYHGTLVGREYNEFLFNCDIGVNPQYQGKYMNTAFPSKVLSYLSHNLKIVSTEIKSIKLSQVAPFIVFSDSDKPESIAKSIISINLKDMADSTNLIHKLDAEFVRDIKFLIDK